MNNQNSALYGTANASDRRETRMESALSQQSAALMELVGQMGMLEQRLASVLTPQQCVAEPPSPMKQLASVVSAPSELVLRIDNARIDIEALSRRMTVLLNTIEV